VVRVPQSRHQEVRLEQIAIDIDRLSVQVGGQKIISNLSLRLAKGRKATLVGPSGSGKSTLLLALLGFVAPAGGTILIFGEELTASSVWRLRTRMAYVSQEPELGEGSVRRILSHPFTFRNNRHLKDNMERAPELMEKLYLPGHLLEKDISSLSGGEKQRVALISALLLEREILLLDEASSALDHSAKQAAIDLLKSREDLTLLSVTHDREWIEAADDLIELSGMQQSPKGSRA
jgi:ABC-type iron transport system FetAB ATPase subunit